MKKAKTKKTVESLKRKLMSSLALLIVASVLMTSTSYAWLVLSTAPEVQGIATNVGANGALEIALLNGETYVDTDKITTDIGDSMSVKATKEANITWGNLIDLSDTSYGLDNITLMPARLNFSGSSTTKVSTGLLAIPSYGYDGRVASLNKDTVTGIYSTSDGFVINPTQEQYGVRAIGVNNGTTGATGTGVAKAQITKAINNAQKAASSTFSDTGSAFVAIVANYAMTNGSATYSETDKETLVEMANGFLTTTGYIETAIRYAVVGNACEAEPDNLETVLAYVKDESHTLSDISTTYPDYLPENAETWIEKLNSINNNLNQVKTSCAALSGGNYTWDELKGTLCIMLDNSKIYLNDIQLTGGNSSDLLSLMTASAFEMTVLPGSGVAADIADFVGEYTAWTKYSGKDVEIVVKTYQTPTYLEDLATQTSDWTASTLSSLNSSDSELAITDICGYAIDLAFRCNAQSTYVQLQTTPTQRTYEDSSSGDLQGGGSYMQFSTTDETFSTQQMIELMDAVRVAFLDDEGEILAIAKLNTSNREIADDGSIKASLYLYEYSINAKGVMEMGERRSSDNKIMALGQNVAKTMTAVVYLDGDIVDNTKVSATTSASLGGILNLQFSSSTELIPAGNNEVYVSDINKTELSAMLTKPEYADIFNWYSARKKLAEYKADLAEEKAKTTPDENTISDLNAKIATTSATIATYEQKTTISSIKNYAYTTVSWNAYRQAYENAKSVSEGENSSYGQIQNAHADLVKAKNALTFVSLTALEAEIDEIREVVGTTEDVAGYAEGGTLYKEGTADFMASSEKIYSVDNSKNLRSDGKYKYSINSWNTLAETLYEAEAVWKSESVQVADMDDFEAIVDAQITALDLAYSKLEPASFYKAYDYNGNIYYLNYLNHDENADTYGRWYDEDFKLVTSDLLILNLDTEAKAAKFATIDVNEYYSILKNEIITPSLTLNKALYTSLTNDKIIGVSWNVAGEGTLNMDTDQKAKLQSLVNKAKTLGQFNDYYNGYNGTSSTFTVTDNLGDQYLSLAQKVAIAEKIIANEKFDFSGTTRRYTNAEIATFTTDLSTMIDTLQTALDQKTEEARTAINDDEKEVLKAAIKEAKRIEDAYEALSKAKDKAKNSNNEDQIKEKLTALNTAITNLGGTAKETPEAAITEAERLEGLSSALATAKNAVTDDDITNNNSEKLTALNTAITNLGGTAKETLADAKTEAERLEALNSALTTAKTEANTAKENGTAKLTALNTAITEFGGTTKTTLADAIAEAENVLAEKATTNLTKKKNDAQTVVDTAGATKTEAKTALDALNAEITALGGTAKTAENTLTLELPDTSIVELVNTDLHPTTNIDLSGINGNIVVSALIVTQNGVVYTAENTVKAYTAYDNIQVTSGGTAVTGTKSVKNATSFTVEMESQDKEELYTALTTAKDAVTSDDITNNDSAKLTALNTAITNLGGTTKTTLQAAVWEAERLESIKNNAANETVASYIWSVSDASYVQLVDANKATCTVTPKSGKNGTITLSVLVTMDNGKTYTKSVQLQVESSAKNVATATELVNAVNNYETLIYVTTHITEAVSITLPESDTRTVTLKGEKIDKLTINAPNATFHIHNEIGDLDANAVGDDCLYIYNACGQIVISKGKLIIEEDGAVEVCKIDTIEGVVSVVNKGKITSLDESDDVKALLQNNPLLAVEPTTVLAGYGSVITTNHLTTTQDPDELHGTCGDNATWRYWTGSGTAEVAGTGRVNDFEHETYTAEEAYNKFKDKIVEARVQTGITELNFPIATSKSLKTIYLPSTLTHIHSYSFFACPALEDVYYDGTFASLKSLFSGLSVKNELGDVTLHCSDGNYSGSNLK